MGYTTTATSMLLVLATASSLTGRTVAVPPFSVAPEAAGAAVAPVAAVPDAGSLAAAAAAAVPEAAAVDGESPTSSSVRDAVDGDAAVRNVPVEEMAASDDVTAADSDDSATFEDEDGDESDEDAVEANADLDGTVDRQAEDLDDADDDEDDDDWDEPQGSTADEGTNGVAESNAGDVDGLDVAENQELEAADIADDFASDDADDDDESDSDVDSDVDSEGDSDTDESDDSAAEDDDLDSPSVRAAGGPDALKPVDHADDGTSEDMSSDDDLNSVDDAGADLSDGEISTDLFGKPLTADVPDADVNAWAAPAAEGKVDQEAVRRIQLGDYVPLAGASPFVVGDADETKA